MVELEFAKRRRMQHNYGASSPEEEILYLKRQLAGEHFVHQYAKRPPIRRRSVTFPVDHFRCHILDRPAKGIGPFVWRRKNLKRIMVRDGICGE